MYSRSDTFLLADVFDNFKNMCLKIYELDPSKFLSAPGLAWQLSLRKTKVSLDLLTDIDMLLMLKKGVRVKTNNKYPKSYDKNKELLCIQYWDVNNLYGSAMSQILSVNNFEWIKDTIKFNKDSVKNYNEDGDEGYFINVTLLT